MDDPTLESLLIELRGDDADRAIAAHEAVDLFADQTWLPQLYDLMANDDQFFTREACATAIIRMEGLKALVPLLKALQRGHEDGHDNDGFSEQVSDLIETNPEEAIPLLEAMRNDPDEHRRDDAEWLLEFAYDALPEGSGEEQSSKKEGLS